MRYDQEQLRTIYYRTDGHCHICHCKVSLRNYGAVGERGAWEIDHSRPRSKGGSDHGNNLFPACVRCNRDKSNVSTRTARIWNGTTRAPLSREKKRAIRTENAVTGGVIGGLLGLAGGPVGMAVGASIGTAVGRSLSVPKV
jgi:5-methylcytosine-specific restriction endonuclease McrA